MNETLWPLVEPLLLRVEKPSRYIDHEYNACRGNDQASYHAIYLYPDAYEIGQSNQAIGILYAISNGIEGVCAERAYLPWVDMIALMREQNIPLFSMESCRPVRSCDLFGITMPHELAATNILEALDLAGIPLHASERGEGDPIVLGGGPCAFNPEPFAPFFDAILIGEGEEAIVELIELHKRLKAAGTPRARIVEALSAIPGVYVPALGREKEITKRVVNDFDAIPAITQQLVPYTEVAHDRLTVEILRGCTRGCRFCQAGMIYRPVRERSANNVVNAVIEGLGCTGYDEVSLTSLSTTDHSQIGQILRRLNLALAGSGVGVSIPSQRMDAFGVEMARLVAGEKKSGLTFAPEAGSQRLRDVINKNVSEENILSATAQAFEAGWRRCKLYFMIGLPTETDEDIVAIATLANRIYATAKDAVPQEQRGNVRLSISVALFVPKAATPFQWCGQITREEATRRVRLLRDSRMHKGIDLHWHDPATSMLEAVLARGGRDIAPLIEAAWQEGARFDAWTEQFQLDNWLRAADTCGIDLQQYASRDLALDAPLPWDHICSGVEQEYFAYEYEQAHSAATTGDCSFGPCTSCGVCTTLGTEVRLGGERHE
jgi:radical SAM superfamily enzyme YgiQ (UPF0313 family)